MININSVKKYNRAEILSAGPRYTPSQDKNAPNLTIDNLEYSLDAFCLSKNYRDYILELSKELSKAISESSGEIQRLFKNNKNSPELLQNLLQRLSIANPIESINITRKIEIVLKIITIKLNDKNRQLINLTTSDIHSSKKNERSQKRTEISKYQLRTIETPINKINYYFQSRIFGLIKSNTILLSGDWGTGKTHFLCDYTKKLLSVNHCCILSIAQNLPLATDPLDAICKIRSLSDNITTLLNDLNDLGEKKNCRSLLIIDGINEGDRNEWKKSVAKLKSHISELNYVAVVISCRSPFQNLIFTPARLKSYKILNHLGFHEIEFEAQEEFFRYYNIPFPEVPLLAEEFSRPLTLKLICKGLENLTNSEKKTTFAGITSGQKGMTYILEKYLADLGEPIEKKFNLPRKFCWELLKGTRSTKNKLEDGLAVRMAVQQKETLTQSEVLEVILNTLSFQTIKDAQSFLKALIHSGILFEYANWSPEGYVETIKLPYQKFSDHIIARHLIGEYLKTSSDSTVKRCFYENKPLGKIFKISKFGHEYDMPNWAEALMIEFPERIKNLPNRNKELIYFLPKNKRLIAPSVEPFLNSLLWRVPSSFSDGTNSLINQLLESKNQDLRFKTLDVILALSIKNSHPYSSHRLDTYLFKMRMAERDLLWSEFLRKSYGTQTAPKIISWALALTNQRISKSVAKNCLTVLMLFLTSVNKPQRDRSTKAIIKIVFLYPDLIIKLTVYSLTINDPYISERMLSASYGVAMNKWKKCKKDFKKAFIPFCNDLIKEMFLPNSKYGTHNTITRDSAIGCITIASLIDINSIPKSYKKYLKPPFKHIHLPFRNPETIDEKIIEEIKHTLHMDFRNYTIGRLIPGRGNYQEDYPGYEDILKQIKDRIYQLGYRLSLFDNIDREIPNQNYGRSEDPSKTDRYGKKYSWIAFYELYGFRQANKLISRERFENRISDITFDPSIPEAPKSRIIKFANLFNPNQKTFSEWLIKGPTPEYRDILVNKNVRGEKGSWVLLHGYIQHSNKDSREIFTFLRGLLIKKENIDKLKKKFFSNIYPGNSSIPDIPENFYTYAGEIPWSTNYAPDLRYASGKPKPNMMKAFSNGKFVYYKNINKIINPLDTQVPNDIFDFYQNNGTPAGRWVNASGISVEIPACTYSWESYHSVVND